MEPNPILRMLHSSKALVMIATLAGAVALVALNKITWDQAERFLTVTVPAWMLAVGIEDAAKHLSNRAKPIAPTPTAEPKTDKPS